ncbi:uncharacterized protein LOC120477616 isoform X4 [Pimephales promelas]|uniref:uncharacterized protein LOC120477616 isoform X4 n=1 Tax=Pimephales promelas TaxID=90988 RepID=UPI0019559EE7|nr:uncharacterized protein LOC120477616 isoform X4 [Pimephales promelas]
MKKIWSKKRFQKTGHSNRTFGRFTHAKFSAPVGSKVMTLRLQKTKPLSHKYPWKLKKEPEVFRMRANECMQVRE